jgi:hypothetical protein
MSPEAIELAVRDDTRTGSYRFICPACMTLVEKRADRKIVDLLSSVGVTVTPGNAGHPSLLEDIPTPPAAERREADPGQVPFTYDDLITFHFLLQDDERVAEAISTWGRLRSRRRKSSS